MDAARPRKRTAGVRLEGESADASGAPAQASGAPAEADGSRERRLAGARRRRGLIVIALPVVAVDGGLWATEPAAFAALPSAYWLMAALAVAVDARPYVLADRWSSSDILPSICFTFALALA